MTARRVVLLDNPAAHVAINAGGCHIWQRAKTRDGYAQAWCRMSQRLIYVHRWMYEQAYGPLAPGMQVDHTCFNTSCINVAHLRPLSADTNNRLQRSALKTKCVHGHEYTPENTYRRPSDNRRGCIECRRGRVRNWRARRAAARQDAAA